MVGGTEMCLHLVVVGTEMCLYLVVVGTEMCLHLVVAGAEMCLHLVVGGTEMCLHLVVVDRGGALSIVGSGSWRPLLPGFVEISLLRVRSPVCLP